MRFIFFFLPVDIQLFQHHLLKMLSFLHWIDSTPLPKISLSCLYGSISVCYSLFHLSLLMPPWILHCLDYSSYIISLNTRYSDTSHFLLLCQFFFRCSRPVPFQISFVRMLSVSTKILTGISLGIAFNLKINLGRIDVYIMWNLPIEEYGISLNLFRCLLISLHFIMFNISILGFGGHQLANTNGLITG